MNPPLAQLGLTPREVREYVSRGWVHPATVKVTISPKQPEPKQYRADYWRNRRHALYERGMTARGTPRKRAWVSLASLTPEQRKARVRRQQKESRIRRSR